MSKIKIMKGAAPLSLALVLVLGGRAFADEGDPFARAMEGAPPAGVQTGALRVPEAPAGDWKAPAQAAPAEAAIAKPVEAAAARPVEASAAVPAVPARDVKPLDDLAREIHAKPVATADAAGPAGVSGPAADAGPAGTAGPAGPSPDAPDPSVEINANYDVTMDVYQKILDNQGTDPSFLAKRIASNEEIVNRYKPQLTTTEDELRRLQVDFMNRAFQLRRQKDLGQLSEAAFQQAIQTEQAKWARKRSAIAGDVEFFNTEIAQAETRLTDLRSQKQAMEARLAREGKLKPKKKSAAEALFEGFNGTLDKLSGFRTRFTMDGSSLPSCSSMRRAEVERESAAAPVLEEPVPAAPAAAPPPAGGGMFGR